MHVLEAALAANLSGRRIPPTKQPETRPNFARRKPRGLVVAASLAAICTALIAIVGGLSWLRSTVPAGQVTLR